MDKPALNTDEPALNTDEAALNTDEAALNTNEAVMPCYASKKLDKINPATCAKTCVHARTYFFVSACVFAPVHSCTST